MKLPEITRCHFPKTISNNSNVSLSALHTKGTLNGSSDHKFWRMISLFVYTTPSKNIKIITHFKWKWINFKLFGELSSWNFFFIPWQKELCTLGANVPLRCKQNNVHIIIIHEMQLHVTKLRIVWSLMWGEKCYVFHKNECVFSNENINKQTGINFIMCNGSEKNRIYNSFESL